MLGQACSVASGSAWWWRMCFRASAIFVSFPIRSINRRRTQSVSSCTGPGRSPQQDPQRHHVVGYGRPHPRGLFGVLTGHAIPSTRRAAHTPFLACNQRAAMDSMTRCSIAV